MKNKILDIISEQFTINEDIENRVDHLLECVENNSLFTLEQVMKWFKWMGGATATLFSILVAVMDFLEVAKGD